MQVGEPHQESVAQQEDDKKTQKNQQRKGNEKIRRGEPVKNNVIGNPEAHNKHHTQGCKREKNAMEPMNTHKLLALHLGKGKRTLKRNPLMR
jgi:hypothetical protein